MVAGETSAVSGFPGKCLQNASARKRVLLCITDNGQLDIVVISGFPGKCLQNASARKRVLLCITDNGQLDILVIWQGVCLKVSFSNVSN